ncbi:MAG: 2,3-bisphosphoglycerate-independent phosphoglycerate mutase, partial [Spirochaetota bacterium]
SADPCKGEAKYEREHHPMRVKKNTAKTSHTINPVPFVIYDPENQGEYSRQLREGLGISSVAATCLNFLGYLAPEDYTPSIIRLKD